MVFSTKMRSLGIIFSASVMLFLTSCVEEQALEPDIQDSVQSLEDEYVSARQSESYGITVTKSLEAFTEDDETKTTLSNGVAVWTTGDTFSMLGIGRTNATATVPFAKPLTYSQLNSMAVGSSKTVMITSVSTGGYKIGTVGSSWRGIANSKPGYRYAGKSITDAQAKANEAQLVSELVDILYRSDASKYKFTITRVSGGFSIKTSDGKYLNTSNGLRLVSTKSTFTLENPTKTSASSVFVKQNTGYSVVNSCLLRIKSGWNYLTSNSTTPTLSSSAGDKSYFYICEVGTQDASSSDVIETPFNNEFTITNTSTGAYSGKILEGSDVNIAVYPYSEKHSFDGKTVKIDVPQVQFYAENSFGQGAYPMAGYLDADNGLAFKNLFGMIKFAITGTSKILSVTVTDNSSVSLWGTATVSSTRVLDGTLSDFKVSGGSNSIVLDCGDGVQLSDTPTNFYIAVPAGAFSAGFTVKLETPDYDLTKSTTKANTITRSKIKSISGLVDSGFNGFPQEPEEPEVPVVSGTFNIMNDLARSYFDNVTYSISDLNNGSSKFKVSTVASSYRADQPKPVDVTWTASGSGTATVTLYSDAQCTVPVDSRSVTLSSGKCSFSDLIPERTYYYQVTNGSTVVATGGFNTTGQVRMIKIDNSFNIRDIGGWSALGGKKIQYEKVYRGGHLDDINSTDKQRLYHLGIMADTDFRPIDMNVEATRFQREDHSNCLTWTNLLGDGGSGSGMFFHKCTDNESYNIMYTNKNTTDKKKYDDGAYVQHMAFVIDAVLSGHPAYFHCKSGADRTGVFALLLEGLLGVAPGDIVKDYELTSFSQEYSGGNSRKYKLDANIGKAYVAVRDNAMKAPASYDTFQKRCYYYFNNCFDRKINASDLDAFIMTMLGMTEAEYAKYKPTGTYDGGSSNSLKKVYYWDCGHNHTAWK